MTLRVLSSSLPTDDGGGLCEFRGDLGHFPSLVVLPVSAPTRPE